MHGAIKIAIAEDHGEYRDLLVGVFLKYRFTVLADSASEPCFINLLNENNLPDIVVAGCSTLHPQNAALVMELKRRYPGVKILVTALFNHYLPVKELAGANIEGCVTKQDIGPRLIVKAAAELYRGRRFFHNVDAYFTQASLYVILQ